MTVWRGSRGSGFDCISYSGFPEVLSLKLSTAVEAGLKGSAALARTYLFRVKANHGRTPVSVRSKKC